MKFNFFLLLFLLQLSVFSQTKIYFLKDSNHNFSMNNIEKAQFILLEDQILDKHSNDSYWFKIPAIKTDSKYIFRILYERINSAKAFQNAVKYEKLQNQRYLSYRFSRDNDFYIRVTPKLHAYIPVELKSESEMLLKESNQFLLNGFYYGFTFLIIIYNLFYYQVFKDDAFLYYALFLTSISFAIFTMDGMLNFYNISGKINNFLLVLNGFSIAYFSSKFANSYLFSNEYYPKLKRFSYILIIILGLLCINQINYYYLLFLNILVFIILVANWLPAVLLFKKNRYTKIFAFAYVIILFCGIDFFILKFLGVSVINVDARTIKIGAFLEMIILSFAVLYRMKMLRKENIQMTTEIINYSKLLKNKNSKNKEFLVEVNMKKLSLRERQIFNLILSEKSNKEIADIVHISVNTVKFHVKNIYDKLKIKSRKEALNL